MQHRSIYSVSTLQSLMMLVSIFGYLLLVPVFLPTLDVFLFYSPVGLHYFCFSGIYFLAHLLCHILSFIYESWCFISSVTRDYDVVSKIKLCSWTGPTFLYPIIILGESFVSNLFLVIIIFSVYWVHKYGNHQTFIFWTQFLSRNSNNTTSILLLFNKYVFFLLEFIFRC